MKKSLCLLLLGLLCLTVRAIPANPTPVRVSQPDGSVLTVALHGDEFFHFTTTADGYTVVKNTAGYYTYARLDGGNLVSSGVVAHDKAQRTAADHAFLANVPKGLTSAAQAQSGTMKLNRRNSAMRRVGADGLMDYDNFRGLIILINYTDKKFSMPNPGEFYNDMVNTHDFTGYTLNGRHVPMTGSVRDYLYDNSAHIFDPLFDVVGPVNVNFTSTQHQGTNNSEMIFNAALEAADSLVNYSDYDTDGDGSVDMVFFLVAGLSSNYSGNNEDLLWPHMYYLYRTPTHDGVRFGLYACSTEIAGWAGYRSDVNGIGTFCHEFGHVLGLPDLYDTDYSGSGGESRNPGEWSIMAGGSGNNYGRNPVGYSLYERYALGFTKPVLINSAGTLEIEPLDHSNVGYRLDTPNEKEFFLIENRQSGKWDQFLPGHGMMVARVDSTNARIWWSNEVNCNPNHMYYELLRADYRGGDSRYDPFPGASGVTSITNFTYPSLLTWDKSFNDYALMDIVEANGIITVNVEEDNSILTVVEDFEQMPETENLSATRVQGTFAQWDFVKCSVVSDENGDKAVGMKKPSQITTSTAIRENPYIIRFAVRNPTTTEAKFKFSYSTDGGETWKSPAEGQITVPANSTESAMVRLELDAPVMLRFNEIAGSSKANCYLDDIKMYYKETWPEPLVGDVDGDGEVNIADVNVLIDLILSGTGNKAKLKADVNDDGEVNIADVNMVIDLILKG